MPPARSAGARGSGAAYAVGIAGGHEPSRVLGAIAAASAAALSSVAFAAPATYPGQKEGDFVAKDFRFQGGETLPEVRLH